MVSARAFHQASQTDQQPDEPDDGGCGAATCTSRDEGPPPPSPASLVRAARASPPTLATTSGYQRARQRITSQHHGSPEWYTPPWLLEYVEAFLGPDYYDPCPPRSGRIIANGLATPWRRQRVFCNPPYGAAIRPWIRKAMTEPVRELLLLVPAGTETQWFAPLFACSLCFIRGRVAFAGPHQRPTNAPHPSVLVYRGRRTRQFAEAFCGIGPITRTMRAYQPRHPQLLKEVEAW